MINLRRKLIFFGELPPSSINGVSVSNYRVLKFLGDKFKVCAVEEKAALNTRRGGFFKKILYLVKPISDLWLVASDSDVFYCNLALSRMGVVKTLFLIWVVKVRSPHVKAILHLHRGDIAEFIDGNVGRFLFGSILKRSYRVIFLSEGMKSIISTIFPSLEQKLFVGLNTVDAPAPCEKQEVKFEYLVISNYLETKGLHDLILNLNESLPFLRLNVYGGISDLSFFKYLSELSNDNIALNKAIGSENKFKYISESKMLLVPSLNEGMPLVILESLSQGTPVICFDVGAIGEYLGSDYFGLVTDLTYGSFIKRIAEVESLSDSEYLLLRNKSKELFWSAFSPECMRVQLESIFEAS